MEEYMKKHTLLTIFLIFTFGFLTALTIPIAENYDAVNSNRGTIQVHRTIEKTVNSQNTVYKQIIAKDGDRMLCIDYTGDTPDTNNYISILFKDRNIYGSIKYNMARGLRKEQFIGWLIAGEQKGMDVFYGLDWKRPATQSSAIAYEGRQKNYAEFRSGSYEPLYFRWGKIEIRYNDYNDYADIGSLPDNVTIETGKEHIIVRSVTFDQLITIDFNIWFDLIKEISKNQTDA
jgi:hypothetical protein